MRTTLFAAAAVAALAGNSARAASQPQDTYTGNLSVQALDNGGTVIPFSSLTPGSSNTISTSGWMITTSQTLNGTTTNSTSYCGEKTGGFDMSLAAAAMLNGVCGDGSAPVATFGGPAFIPAFIATCTYLSGPWTSLYYSPTNTVVHMPKQQSACNGQTNMTQKFHNGGNGSDYSSIAISAAQGVYGASIMINGTFNVQTTFPSQIFNPALEPARPDIAAMVSAQRAVQYNNQLQAQ